MTVSQNAQMMTPTQLADMFVYERETGLLRWKRAVGYGGRVPAGSIAGNVHRGSNGYVQLRFGGRLYYAHRIAWALVNGEWPPLEIDHINGCPSDNRLVNLRLASREQNLHNTRKPGGVAGVKGVSWSKHKQAWHARIRSGGRQYHLGYFRSFAEAAAIRIAATQKLHGEFARIA